MALRIGQLDRIIADVRLAGMEGHAKSVERDGLGRVFLNAFHASENGSDARHQFVGPERFRQVIVRTSGQPGHAIGRRRPCGQQDDRQLTPQAELAQNFEPVEVRQHYIENDQVEWRGERGGQTGGAVVYRSRMEVA